MKKIYVYVYMFILFFSLIPSFTFIADATSTLSLSVTGNGSHIGLPQHTGGKEHYQCIDGNNNEYVGTINNAYTYDTFILTDHTTECGTINNVTIKTRLHDEEGSGLAKHVIYTGGTPYYGSEITVTNTDYDSDKGFYNTTFETNPATSSNWTWDDIDNVEYGIACKNPSGADTVCFYLYVIVNYSNNPSGLDISDRTNTTITLTWSKGCNSTVVIRNESNYPPTPYNGTEIYNGTGETTIDTGLTNNTLYYYRAWNWNGTAHSDRNTSISGYTAPQIPQDIKTTVVGTNNLNISWTIGTGANKTVVRESASSQPLSPTSGTELYNDTGSYVIDTSISQGTYYSLWSYNTTTGLFSERTNLTWYVVWVNAYDSSNGSNISGYSVFFSNTSGTQTHIATGCTNPTIINISDCPQGDDILIIVKKPDTYKDAVYYRNIAISGNYYINAYLTVNTTTALYYLQVVETIETEYGMYEKSISTASVIITKYINTTGEYKTLYSLLTDGSGVCNCYLEYGELYKISISKSGYDSTISDYIPQPPNEYGQTDTKTFKLTRTEETPPASYDRFYENITITTRMYDINTTSYTGYITIHYQDINTSTINTAIYLYELYNNTETYQNTTSKTNNNSYTISFYDINTTRIYKIILYYNNTADFSDHSSPYIVTVQPLHTYTSRTKFSIDDRITDIVGPFTIMGNTVGYAPVIAIAIGVILLVMLGPYNTGLGIIAAGLGLGITELLFSIFFTDTFPVLLVTLTPVLIILGILYMWTKRQGVEGL